MSREAMQLALEALEMYMTMDSVDEAHLLEVDIAPKAITALRQAIEQAEKAQPEMEPCAGRNCGSTNPNLHSAECFEDYEKSTGMNQWVGLTADEIWKCNKAKSGSAVEFHICVEHQNVLDFAESIEAKLKEKNA